MKFRFPITSLMFSLVLWGCSSTGPTPLALDSSNKRDLLVWWSEGYYPEETDAVEAITSKWEKESGKKVNLVFFNDGEISQRATEILNGGPKPDLLYGYSVGDSHGPSLAYRGFVVKTDDVINAFVEDYSPGIIENVTFLNKD